MTLTTLNVHEFKPAEGGRQDWTPAVAAAVSECERRGALRMVFPAGRYEFWPDRAGERYLFVSNNDEGLKRVVFDFTGVDGLEIDGQGSEFIFHGAVTPFLVARANGVSLRNFSVDWARTFHTEATVLASREDGVDLLIPEAYPYKIEHGRLVPVGEFGERFGIHNILEFDGQKRETAFLVCDNYGIGARHSAREIGPRQVRFTAAFQEPRPQVGNVLALMDDGRHCPAFVISESADVTLSDITIHHAGAMGVIAQRTENVLLERLRVKPAPSRMISTTADATHFVNCRGHVRIVDCVMENQMDDPTNVHGVYARVTRRVSDTVLEVRLMHGQQLGFTIAEAGETMELVRSSTLARYHEAVVENAERVNKEFTLLTFDRPLPADVEPGDAVGNLTWSADLTIRGTRARGNRARGFLISTPGRVVVEDNYLHTPGPGILIEGDANFWFEAGAVQDVLIRRNHFDNCNYGLWGNAAIQITPGVREEHMANTQFHRNVRIEGNTFDVFDRRLVRARCVAGLTFRDNRVTLTDAYPPRHEGDQPVETIGCTDVCVENNGENVPGQAVDRVKLEDTKARRTHEVKV